MSHNAPSRIILVVGALVTAAAYQSNAAEARDRTTLIAACKVEAVRGHLQGFLDERRKHHERMTAICQEWRNVSATDREALSKRCLAEARRGPSIGHRQRPMNQSHIFRLRALCRKLATTCPTSTAWRTVTGRVLRRIQESEAADALTVPVGALFRENDSRAVFAVANGRARSTPVKIGRRNSRFAQVLSGISEGTQVVLHPSDRIAGTSVAARATR